MQTPDIGPDEQPTTGHARRICLVTGCAGFIASHLCEALLAEGHSVVGVDDLSGGRLSNMASFLSHPRFYFLEQSVLEPGLLTRAISSYGDLSAVFHLAAIVSVPYSMDHHEETMAVNHQAAVALHVEAHRHGVGAFVFAGSAAEYGAAADLPLSEWQADGVRRLSPYGEAKYLVSKAIQVSGYGASLRFFNVYGPRQDPGSPYSGVISRFIDAALAGQEMTIFGDGSQTRDFLHVFDAVRAYLLAAGMANQAAPVRGIFNVGSQNATSILDLATIVAASAGGKLYIRHDQPRPGDIVHSVADVSSFRAACGFRNAIELTEGVRLTIEAIRSM